RGAKLESGQLELKRLNTRIVEAHQISNTVKALVSAARFFHLEGVSVPEALARNAAQDPVAQVRLRNLSVLFRDHPRTETARQPAARGRWDPDPAVRLRAAEFLPSATASPVLKDLVLSPALKAQVRPSEEARVRAEALRVLSRKCP